MPNTAGRDDQRRLVETLVEARRIAGVRQVDLADRLGRTQAFVANIERGERRVTILEFIAIAEGLEMPPADLFSTLPYRLRR